MQRFGILRGVCHKHRQKCRCARHRVGTFEILNQVLMQATASCHDLATPITLAELPARRRSKVQMLLDLRGANALGVTEPVSLLGRTDKVIE